jgi:HEAT repeat protein
MPHGLHAALVSRTEDLSFTGTLLVHWAALAMTLPALWTARRSRQTLIEIAIVLGALSMYLQLYPRSDFMHLIVAAPLTMVVAGCLAFRFTGWFPTETGLRSILRTAIVGGMLCFVAFRVSPNLASVLTWDNGPALRRQATLELVRAPLALELGREPRFRALSETVAYIRENSAPGERIFTFPSIEVLCFLADRTSATRHGYFFSGWPGHEVEAEVVSTLAADPPRLIVVLHAHPFFFSTAPAYYYALREFVRRNYREVARFRHFVIMAHLRVPETSLTRSAASEAPLGSELDALYGARLRGERGGRLEATRALAAERLDFPWTPATALLEDPDPDLRAAAIAALVNATEPAVAVPLSRALLAARIPEDLRFRVLRHVGDVGDERVIPMLLEHLNATSDWSEYVEILDALDGISWRLALTDYWFGDTDEIAVDELPTSADWRARLANPEEPAKLRSFLARTLPRVGADGLASTLQTIVESGSGGSGLRASALAGLLRLPPDQRGGDPFAAALSLLASDRIFAPSLLLQLYRENPARYGPVLVEALADVRASDPSAVREEMAWVASATGDPVFRDVFAALLAEASVPVRLAALAGLERIADPTTRAAVEGAVRDPDFEVRQFAVRTLHAFDAARSSSRGQ